MKFFKSIGRILDSVADVAEKTAETASITLDAAKEGALYLRDEIKHNHEISAMENKQELKEVTRAIEQGETKGLAESMLERFKTIKNIEHQLAELNASDADKEKILSLFDE